MPEDGQDLPWTIKKSEHPNSVTDTVNMKGRPSRSFSDIDMEDS